MPSSQESMGSDGLASDMAALCPDSTLVVIGASPSYDFSWRVLETANRSATICRFIWGLCGAVTSRVRPPRAAQTVRYPGARRFRGPTDETALKRTLGGRRAARHRTLERQTRTRTEDMRPIAKTTIAALALLSSGSTPSACEPRDIVDDSLSGIA